MQMFLGSALNGVLVFLGGILGSVFKKAIPEKLSETLMQLLGICVVFIGISGALSGQNIIVTVVSLTLGTFLGYFLKLDAKITRLGDYLQSKVKLDDGKTSVSAGFVNCSLLVCIGAMAIIGPMNEAISGDHSVTFAKSAIDGVISVIMASAMGFGVAFAGALVFIYEALIALVAGFIAPALLNEEIIAEMSCVGSLLIVGVGLNMLKLTKIRVIDGIPAMFIPILLIPLLDLIAG